MFFVTCEENEVTGFRANYLAKQLANADSGTCGPHRGSSPLHLVLAFCSAALSHSSRTLACLKIQSLEMNTFIVECCVPRAILRNLKYSETGTFVPRKIKAYSPYCCHVAIDVHDVEVRHGTVTLSFPRF